MNANEKLNELCSILKTLKEKQTEVYARGDIEAIQTLGDTINKLALYIEARKKEVCDEVNLS